jgi:hypothetical protein
MDFEGIIFFHSGFLREEILGGDFGDWGLI